MPRNNVCISLPGIVPVVADAFDIPYISTTAQEFNESAVPAFIAATVDLANNGGPDIAAGSVISITYNATSQVVSPLLLGV